MEFACGSCGILQDERGLVCAACGGLIYAARMQELQLAARANESAGNLAAALAGWRQILPLLPADARQRPAVVAEIQRLESRAASPSLAGNAAGAAASAVPVAPAPHAITPANPTGSAPAKKRGLLGTIGAAILIALSKLKLLLLGLTKFKTVLSMAIMAAVYTSFYGWTFAVGIVLLIYVHEMGHVLAIRARGMDATWPVFIPFVGAFVRLKTSPRNAAEDAYIGYAGPLFGSIAAALVWAVGFSLGSDRLVALAFFGFYLNFFNLIAIPPLDGGRVTNALDRATWIAVLLPMWAATAWNPDGMVLLVTIVATVRGLSVIFGRNHATTFSVIGTRARWSAAVAYALLAVTLIAGMKVTLPERHPAKSAETTVGVLPR